MFRVIDGRSILVVDVGAGELPVVLHSGWIGSWEDWLPQVEALSRRTRVVAFDHRGAGRSPVAADQISRDALVEDLFAVLADAGIERCVLGAFSSGAAVVLQAAAERPQTVAGIALMCPVFPEATADFEALLAADFDAGIDAFLDLCLPEARHRDVSAVRRWASDVLHQSGPEQAVRLLQTMRPAGAAEEIAPLEVPGVIVIGAEDPMSDEGTLPRWTRLLPRARTEVVPRAGHLVAFTDPAPVNAALVALLDELGAASAG